MAEHPDIIVRLADAIRSNDLDAVVPLYSDDVVITDPLYDNVIGKEGITSAMRSWYAAFRVVSFEIVETISEGSRIAGHFDWVAVHQGEYLGVPPSGKEFSSWVLTFFDTRDGLITRELATWDCTQLLRLQDQHAELATS